MKRRSIRFLIPSAGAARALGWLVLAAVAGWPLSRLQAVPFTVTGLTEIKGEGVTFTTFTPRDVNDSGQVVGNARFADGNTRAVLFQNGIFTDLGHLGTSESEAAAINNAGHVVGTSFVPVPDPDFPGEFFNMPRAFLHNGETMINLGTLPVFDPSRARSEAIAINDAGQIVGHSSFRTGEFSDAFSGPFLFQGVGMTRPDGGGFGIAGMMGINASGQMIGFGNEQFLGFNAHAFLLDGGALTDLHLLIRGDDVSPSSESWPTGINNSGQVVGVHWSFPSLQERHFLFDNGKVTLLPRQPIGINDHGHILCNGGVIIDGAFQSLDELAAGFFTEGATPGFRGLIFGRVGPPPRPTFASPFISNGFITGMGRFFDGTSFSNRPFLLSFTTGETDFIWEGAEGFAFNHGPNWSDGVVPGAADTVTFSAPGQLKSIEFANGGLVANERLLAIGSSRTEVDLNQTLWRLAPGAGGPDAAGQLLLQGGDLTLKDGTLEVFGKVIARNDGPASNGLGLREGGKLVVRDDDLDLGSIIEGSRATLATVRGEGSLLEARDITLGSGGAGGSTTTVSEGAFLLANRNLTVGTLGSSSAGLLVRGSPGTSVVQVTEGGSLDVGTLAATGIVSVIDGAQAILNDVTVTLGSELSEGRFTVAGADSRLFGGSFHVLPQGHLFLGGGQGSPALLSVEGGEAVLREGFFAGGNGRFNLGAGTLTLESGAAANISALAVNGGALTISQGGRLQISGEDFTRVDGRREGELGEGSAAVPALLEVTGGNAARKSQLVMAGPLGIGFLGEGRLRVLEGATVEVGQGLTITGGGEGPASVVVGGSSSSLSVAGLTTFGAADGNSSGALLRVEASGTFSVRPDASGASGETILRTGTSLNSSGVVSLGKATLNGGLLEVPDATGRILAEAVTVNSGSVDVVAGRLESQQVTVNDGGLNVVGGGRLLVGESLRLSGSGLALVAGAGTSAEVGSLRLGAPNGSLTVFSGANFAVRPAAGQAESTILEEGTELTAVATVSLGNTRIDGGTLNLREASDTIVRAPLMTVNSGTLSLLAGRLEAGVLTLNGGALSGRGRVIGTVVQNGGVIAPGESPGTLTIEGDYTQNGGTIVLEISGLTPATQHDQLAVTGNVNLAGGTVEFAFTDGFTPRAGQTFTLIDAGAAFTGTPAVTVSGLQPGWEFSTAINPATGTFALTSLTDGVANAANFPDQDDDGLPNDWETANGLDPNDRADASRDPDGDGQSNLDEYRAGTDPRSATSAFALLSVQPYLGGYLLTYTAQSGKTYRVTGSTDLKTWTELLPPSPSWTTASRTATVPAAQATAFPFFRIEIVP